MGIILIAALLFFTEKYYKRRTLKAVAFIIQYRFFIPLFALFAGIALRLFVFRNIPHIQDSIHYQMIAQWMINGRLSHPPLVSYEFYRYIYFIGSPTTFYSLFLPGYPLFLAPFLALHLSWLANPLLLAITILITGKLAEKMGGKELSTLTMIFALCSSFVVFMSGTGMAHNFTALLTVATVYLFYNLIYTIPAKKASKQEVITPLAIGFMIGWLLVTRPQNAIFLSAALLPFALYFGKNHPKRAMLYLLLTTIPFALWLGTLMIYNHHFTGSPLTFIQDIYFNYSEPTLFCHRLGMGKGCFKSNWDVLPPGGLSPTHAVFVTWKRLTSLSMNLLAHPMTLIFPVVAFFPLTDKNNRKFLLPASLFLTSVFGYFFFYFDANVFGPRYYYETTFFLLIMLAAGVLKLPKIYPQRVVKYSIIAFFPILFFFHFTTVVPRLIETYHHGFWDVNAQLHDEVKRLNIHNAIVFINPQKLIGSGIAVMDMSNIEGNDIIYARDLGEEENTALMTRFPTRKFYRAKWEKWKLTRTEPPQIAPIKKTIAVDHIFVEIEQKSYPLACRPDWCNTFPDKAVLNRFMPIPPPYKLPFSNNKGWYCRLKQDQCYDFGQYIPSDGEWKMEIRLLTGPQMGTFVLTVDGKPFDTLNMNNGEYRKKSHHVTIRLSKGFHIFALTSKQKKDTFFMLDFVVFDRNLK